MRNAKGSAQRFLALLLSVTMALGNISVGVAHAAESDAASARYLTTEEGVQFAIQWAKVGYTGDADLAINAAIGVMSIGFPPAGAFLGVAYGLVKALGGGGPDPVFEAIKAINQRLDQHAQAIVDLTNNLNAFKTEVRAHWNQNRLERLRTLVNGIRARRDELQLRPQDAPTKRTIVNNAKIYAGEFLPLTEGTSSDLWQWNDVLLQTVETIDKQTGERKRETMPHSLRADFKVLPTFEYYVNAILLLIAAVEYESAGNVAYVKKYHSEDLLKHAAFLVVRPSWRGDISDAQTLPEHVKARVSSRITGGSRYPTNRVCYVTFNVDDIMRRTTTANFLEYPAASDNQLCTYSPAMAQSFKQWMDVKEDEIERAYYIEAMALLTAKLQRLATTGTSREPEPGKFDFTFYKKNYLYAVKPNGELLWYSHLAGVDRNPPKSAKELGVVAAQPGATSARMGEAVGGLTKSGQTSAVPSIGAQTGKFGEATGIGSRLGGAATGQAPSSGAAATLPSGSGAQREAAKVQPTGARVAHQWEGPRLVTTGWQTFREVIPAGLSGMYALTPDGMLKWFRHDGFLDGTAKWKGPVDVGRGGSIDRRIGGPAGSIGVKGAAMTDGGWNSCKKIIAGGDGVLYCVGADGTLRWYRHGDVADASTRPSWSGPLVAGSGWGNFVHVFSTGEGRIYAVRPSGELLWYWHKGYQMGQNIWDGPKQVATGWANFKRVFSPGAGVIYAMQPDGSLVWYEHEGYRDGQMKWLGPMQIAADWGSFVQVFPRMWGTPIQPR